MALKDDPPQGRSTMIAAMAPLGLGEQPAEAPVHGGSDIEALLEYVTTAEEGFEALFGAL